MLCVSDWRNHENGILPKFCSHFQLTYPNGLIGQMVGPFASFVVVPCLSRCTWDLSQANQFTHFLPANLHFIWAPWRKRGAGRTWHSPRQAKPPKCSPKDTLTSVRISSVHGPPQPYGHELNLYHMSSTVILNYENRSKFHTHFPNLKEFLSSHIGLWRADLDRHGHTSSVCQIGNVTHIYGHNKQLNRLNVSLDMKGKSTVISYYS